MAIHCDNNEPRMSLCRLLLQSCQGPPENPAEKVVRPSVRPSVCPSDDSRLAKTVFRPPIQPTIANRLRPSSVRPSTAQRAGPSLRWKRNRSPSPTPSAEPLKRCRSLTRWGHLEQYVAAVAMARGKGQTASWSSMLSGWLPGSFNPPLPFQMRGSDGHLITVGSLPNA